MIKNIVVVFKGISSIVKMVELFLAEWIAYDIKKLDNKAESLKQELDVINAKLKESKNDLERRALLRTLSRLR